MMLNEMSDDEPPQRSFAQNNSPSPLSQESKVRQGPIAWFKGLIKGKESNSDSLREALEEYIEEIEESSSAASIDTHHALVTNVLKTHDLEVDDIMIPRVDIVSFDIDDSFDNLKKLLIEKQYSRIPLYRGSMDDIVGAIHIKDILASLLAGKPFNVEEHLREVLFVSPSMPLLDLLQMMKEDKKHMALVVDEFGGIDGLVTINDVIEAIIGDIEDEFGDEDEPKMILKPDGTLVSDGRMDMEEIEELYGPILTEEEREDVDTLGGLTMRLAGHVPLKGESFDHSTGIRLEVLDSDGRRVKRVRLRNLPQKISGDDV